jgi:SAM-dependent methyltransferase
LYRTGAAAGAAEASPHASLSRVADTPAPWQTMPDPGDILLARAAGSTDRAWFYESGRDSARDLERTLSLAGRSIDSFESILDFGCGCGRVLLWLEEVGRRRELHGCDVDADAIAWAAQHIPYCRFAVNGPDPPLPYGDGAFDLVVNHSVFTHLDEGRQDAWLRELHRVTRPGALLVVSVHGEHALGEERTEAHTRLEQHGHLFMADTRPAAELGQPEWYATAYHAPWYVFEHWARWFAIRGYVPRAALDWQDHVLLERTAHTERRPLRARPPQANAEQLVRAAQARIGAAPSQFGGGGVLLRRLVLRLMRPYTSHQAEIDLALARAIDELGAAPDEVGAAPDERRPQP